MRDETNGADGLSASRTSFARLETRRDEILGDRVFTGDSTELIREASEVGDGQADDGRGFDREAFERLVKLRKKHLHSRPTSDKPDHELWESQGVRMAAPYFMPAEVSNALHRRVILNALAKILGCEYWTADRRFYRGASAVARNVRWIGEFVAPG